MLFRKLFFRKAKSKKEAKERLQFILVQDRINLSPEIIDRMREEIIEVISRYVEVERSAIEIELKRNQEQTTLQANIPVRGIRR